jgi:hypothetical protein
VLASFSSEKKRGWKQRQEGHYPGNGKRTRKRVKVLKGRIPKALRCETKPLRLGELENLMRVRNPKRLPNREMETAGYVSSPCQYVRGIKTP